MLRRLNYKQKTDNREATEVIKGVAKRVIVVKSPDPKVFEEAIFIVREDYMKTAGVTIYAPQRKNSDSACRGTVNAHRQRSGGSNNVFHNVK